MSFVRDLLGYRRFLTLEEVKSFVHQDNPSGSGQLRALLIFETSRQRTWLVVSGWMLYCVLDDRQNERPTVLWRTPLDQTSVMYFRDKTAESYELHVANLQPLVVSRRLFLGRRPDEVVREFVMGHVTGG